MSPLERICIAALLTLGIAGCSGEEVYRPHLDPAQRDKKPGQAVKPATSKAPPKKTTMVGKLGDLDVTKFGIPVYPSATIEADQTLEFKKEGGGRQIQMSLSAYDTVSRIAEWYKNEIEATDALKSVDLATLAGKTRAGYPIRISVASVDAKSIISITVDENSTK